MPKAAQTSPSLVGLYWIGDLDRAALPDDFEGMRDELGLGSISEHFAERFFPHFTVLLTKARYFFLSAALADEALERSRPPLRSAEADFDHEDYAQRWRSEGIRQWARLEPALKDALVQGEPTSLGIVGKTFKLGDFSRSDTYRVFSRYQPCLFDLGACAVNVRGASKWLLAAARNGGKGWSGTFEAALDAARSDIGRLRDRAKPQPPVSFALHRAERSWLRHAVSVKDSSPTFSADVLWAAGRDPGIWQDLPGEVVPALRFIADRLPERRTELLDAEAAARAIVFPVNIYRRLLALLRENPKGLSLAATAAALLADWSRFEPTLAGSAAQGVAGRLPKAILPHWRWLIDLHSPATKSGTPALIERAIRRIQAREGQVLAVRRGRQPALRLIQNCLSRGPGFARLEIRAREDSATSGPALRLRVGMNILRELL